MKSTTKKIYLLTIQSTILFICAYLFWSKIYYAHLYFHEQYQLFQFTSNYFIETISLPGGFTHYLSRFITQFFYNAQLGSIIMAIIITLIQLATVLNIKECNKVSLYPISFIPAIAIWVFLLQADAMPVLAINILFVLYSLYLCKKIRSKNIRLACELIISILLFFIAGGNTLIFVLIAGEYEIMLTLKNRNRGEATLIALASISISLLIPLIGTFIYNYPYDQLFKGYASYRYLSMECNEREIALIVTTIVLFTLQSIDIKVVRKSLISSLLFFAISVFGFIIIRSKVNIKEEQIFCYDYLTRMEKWDEIIKMANKNKPTTIWEESCLNLALAHKGILCDKMFHYNQQGINSLLPVYKLDYITPMIGGEPYFYMGIVNTAQRFAFEAMEAIPDYQKSARCYKRLVITNLVNRRYDVASQYIRILEKALYYRGWAKEMRKFLYNDKLIAKDKVMGRLQKIRYKEDFFFNEEKVEGMIYILLIENPNNWMAWQYLFATCLEKKSLTMLTQFVALMNKLCPNNRIPIHVQEALLLDWVQKYGKLDGYQWNIDNEVKERFIKFANAANQSESIAKNALRMQFSDTYGCYYLLGKEADYE